MLGFPACFFGNGPVEDPISSCKADSAMACQAKCKAAQFHSPPRDALDCFLFSFVVETKECLLFTANHVGKTSDTNNTVISGPVMCGKLAVCQWRI